MANDSFPWLDTEAAEADAKRLVMVRGLSAYSPLAERIRRPGSRIGWLTTLLESQAPARVVRATPYFWFYLREAFAALRTNTVESLDRALDGLAVAALDTFSGSLRGFPPGDFPLPDLSGKQLLRLGIAFPQELAPANARAGGAEMAIDIGSTLLRLCASEGARSTSHVPVRRILDASVDLGRSQQQIEQEAEAVDLLSEQLVQACSWIDLASPGASRLMREEIHFFVPLRRSDNAHFSFTLSQMPGLLFVGGSVNWLPIVEALVHETGHARLHHANEVYPLVRQDDAEICYSPWRNDPRPPTGVLHGFYVFRLVLDFWTEVLEQRRAPLDDAGQRYVRSRVALIHLQLGEAIAVLEKVDMAPFGRRLVEALAAGMRDSAALPVSQRDLDAARTQTAQNRTRALAAMPDLVA